MENNRSLAEILIEAACILDEDAYTRHLDKKIENARAEYKKDQKRVSMGKDPKCLTDKKYNGTDLNTRYQWSKEREIYPESHLDVVKNNDHYERYKDLRKGSEEGYTLRMETEKAKSKDPKNPELHDRINKRTEEKNKSQNEAVEMLAKLLIEAASIVSEM